MSVETDILSLANTMLVVPPNTTVGVTAIAGQVQAWVALIAGATGSIVSTATDSATMGFFLSATPFTIREMRGIFFLAAAGATCTFQVLRGKTAGF